MSTKANHFKIGLFVLAAAVVLILGIVFLGAGRLFRTKIMAETYIDESVNGLDIGSPVKYRGVQIGSVREIDFAHRVYGEVFHESEEEEPDGSPETVRPVLVRFVIYPDSIGYQGEDLRLFLRDEIERGLRIRLSAQGITGLFYLEVDYADPVPPDPLAPEGFVPEDFYIPSISSPFQLFTETLNEGLREIDPKAIGEIIQNVAGLTSSVQKLITDLDEVGGASAFVGLLRSAEDTLGCARDQMSSMGLTQTMHEIRRAVADLRVTVVATSSTIARAGVGIDQLAATWGETGRAVTRASRAVERMSDAAEAKIQAVEGFDELTSNVRTMAGSLGQTLAGVDRTVRRVDRLISIEERSLQEIVENLRDFSRDLREFGQQAKQYPSQVLFGDPPRPVEMGPGVSPGGKP